MHWGKSIVITLILCLTITLGISGDSHTDHDMLVGRDGKTDEIIKASYSLSGNGTTELDVELIQPGPAPANFSVQIASLSTSQSNVSLQFELYLDDRSQILVDENFSEGLAFNSSWEGEGFPSQDTQYEVELSPGTTFYQELFDDRNCLDCDDVIYYFFKIPSDGEAEIEITYTIIKATPRKEINAFLLPVFIGLMTITVIRSLGKRKL